MASIIQLVIQLIGGTQMKKFKMVVWGFKCKSDGIILTGHDGKPITNLTKKETERGLGRDWKAVKIIIQEA